MTKQTREPDPKKAWWRGKRVAAAGHDLKWYASALAEYNETEREAFLAGFAGQPFDFRQ
jgi:hypothetical protein